MIFGLPKNNVDAIRSIFSEFSGIEKVILFGSRAKGNFKPASDIDLVIVGESLDISTLNKISLRLDDVYLPWVIDLSLLNQIENKDLIDHINRVGKVFYSKKENMN